jgi:hypothetical protein
MKTLTQRLIGMRLELVIIAFFVLAVLSSLAVYVADPTIYASSLSLTSSLADRYPVPVTLFLVGVIALIALLILGVVRHWRWVFWLTLIAFGSAVLRIPVTFLQIAGILPNADPLWYSLLQIGVTMVEIGIAVWMIHVYRREGVWAMGRNKNKRPLHEEKEH